MHGDIVAPHMGAWIEMFEESLNEFGEVASHPTWVRGLKCSGVVRGV